MNSRESFGSLSENCHGEYSDLWKNGGLFHDFRRTVVDKEGHIIDRLGEILPSGLIPPILDSTGKVIGNWHGISNYVEKRYNPDTSYNCVVFMHRVNDSVRTLFKPNVNDGRTFVFLFLRSDLPVLTPSDMGNNWPVLTPIEEDEVYTKQIISPDNFEAVVVKTGTAPETLATYSFHLRTSGIRLFDYSGTRFA